MPLNIALGVSVQSEETMSSVAPQPTDGQHRKDLVESTFAFFREHPAVLVSLAYAQITSIGIIYSWTLYESFGVNIFDFAEANDFLLASLKEPFALVMSVITVILLGVQMWYFTVRRRKRGALSSGTAMTYLWVFVITALVYTLFPSHFFAKKSAGLIQENKAGHVTVRYKIESQSPEATAQEANLSLIGTSEKFAFFYEQKTGRTLAVSLSNIQVISFPTKLATP